MVSVERWSAPAPPSGDRNAALSPLSPRRQGRSPPPDRSRGCRADAHASVEHLRGAGLIASAVVEEVLKLLLSLDLALDLTRTIEALGAGNRRHDGGEIGELLGLKRDELVARLRGLQRARGRLARRDERADLGAGRVEILHDASLDAHGVLESGSRVLPARLCVSEKLLRRGPAGIGLRIGPSEGLIDRADAVGDSLRLGQELLGLGDRLFAGGE